MQDLGLQLLEWIDNYAEQQEKSKREIQEIREIKLAMIAAGKLDPAKAFPEIFDAEDAEDEDIDYSGVEWSSPSDLGGIDEYERTMALLAENSMITTTDAEPSAPRMFPSEEVTAPPQQRVEEPDDVEWI